MNKIFKNTCGALLAALAFAACSPEEFAGPDQSGVPSIMDAKATATVDQTTNAVTFTLDNAASYPVWLLPSGKKTTYSTVNGQTVIFSVAGDYKIPYRIGNRNGISAGTDTLSFHIDNSIVNFDQYYNLLAGGSEKSGKSKEWRIANTLAGHLGCGPLGTTGTGWYSAQPNEKAAMGLYDDRLTFTTESGYTYDPGKGGTVYVNKGATFGTNPGNGNDYTANVEQQTADYHFEVEGTCLLYTSPSPRD